MKSGFFVLSIVGLLFGIVLLFVGNAFIGVLIAAICIIYLIFRSYSQKQAQKQTIETLLQSSPPPQQEQPQEEPRKRQWTIDE
jgi:predicted lipid-binding transport protein (Tim44 family)